MSDAQGIVQFLNAVGEIARGAMTPAVQPVWARELLSARTPPHVTHTHREFDEIPDSQRTPFPPHEELVERSFFFDPTVISALKQQIPFPCTSFEVLAAATWRARTIALRLDPDDELRFMFNINLRSKMSTELPEGYYGNVFVYPAVISNAGKLCASPLSYAVKLVKEAKAKATGEYIRSMADLMATRGRPPFAMNGAPRVYFVSDNTRTGFAEVDYGWGMALYGGPAVGGFDALPGVLSFYVSFRNKNGEQGTVVPMCLPNDAMERFADEIEELVQPSIVHVGCQASSTRPDLAPVRANPSWLGSGLGLRLRVAWGGGEKVRESWWSRLSPLHKGGRGSSPRLHHSLKFISKNSISHSSLVL